MTRRDKPNYPNRSIGVCGKHGKKLFLSRKAARQFARLANIDGVNAYACDEQPGLWHLGHLQPADRDRDRRQREA